ncbi:MAG: hypothetical protein RR458_05495 [Clostridia bacterium]
METKQIERIGYWWNDKNIELVKVADGRVFALCGWNGEQFNKCWECLGENYKDASEESYILKPVYRYELKENASVDLDYLEEHDDKEFQRQCEFVDFKIEY